ncbi:MAG: hypothetical protein GY711_01010 [bacterium]|nr:hypothetical protein [bacterium]
MAHDPNRPNDPSTPGFPTDPHSARPSHDPVNRPASGAPIGSPGDHLEEVTGPNEGESWLLDKEEVGPEPVRALPEMGSTDGGWLMDHDDEGAAAAPAPAPAGVPVAGSPVPSANAPVTGQAAAPEAPPAAAPVALAGSFCDEPPKSEAMSRVAIRGAMLVTALAGCVAAYQMLLGGGSSTSEQDALQMTRTSTAGRTELVRPGALADPNDDQGRMSTMRDGTERRVSSPDKALDHAEPGELSVWNTAREPHDDGDSGTSDRDSTEEDDPQRGDANSTLDRLDDLDEDVSAGSSVADVSENPASEEVTSEVTSEELWDQLQPALAEGEDVPEAGVDEEVAATDDVEAGAVADVTEPEGELAVETESELDAETNEDAELAGLDLDADVLLFGWAQEPEVTTTQEPADEVVADAETLDPVEPMEPGFVTEPVDEEADATSWDEWLASTEPTELVADVQEPDDAIDVPFGWVSDSEDETETEVVADAPPQADVDAGTEVQPVEDAQPTELVADAQEPDDAIEVPFGWVSDSEDETEVIADAAPQMDVETTPEALPIEDIAVVIDEPIEVVADAHELEDAIDVPFDWAADEPAVTEEPSEVVVDVTEDEAFEIDERMLDGWLNLESPDGTVDITLASPSDVPFVTDTEEPEDLVADGNEAGQSEEPLSEVDVTEPEVEVDVAADGLAMETPNSVEPVDDVFEIDGIDVPFFEFAEEPSDLVADAAPEPAQDAVDPIEALPIEPETETVAVATEGGELDPEPVVSGAGEVEDTVADVDVAPEVAPEVETGVEAGSEGAVAVADPETEISPEVARLIEQLENEEVVDSSREAVLARETMRTGHAAGLMPERNVPGVDSASGPALVTDAVPMVAVGPDPEVPVEDTDTGEKLIASGPQMDSESAVENGILSPLDRYSQWRMDEGSEPVTVAAVPVDLPPFVIATLTETPVEAEVDVPADTVPEAVPDSNAVVDVVPQDPEATPRGAQVTDVNPDPDTQAVASAGDPETDSGTSVAEEVQRRFGQQPERRRSILRRAEPRGRWNKRSIPKHAIDKKERLSTPYVGLVRLVFLDGEVMEGRLTAVGEGLVSLETELGRLSIDGRRVSKIERIDRRAAPAGAPAKGKGPLVRARVKGGAIIGYELARKGDEITLLTEKGFRITVQSDDVVPVSANRSSVAIKRRKAEKE